MPIFDRFKVTRTAKFPAAYLIPADAADAIALLNRHGIVVEKLMESWHGEAEEFRIDKSTAARAFQGHRIVDLEGKFSKASISVDKGTYLVRTAQPLGILVFHLLEPESLDGVAAWGFLGPSLAAGQKYPIAKVYDQVHVATERNSGPSLIPDHS
jgi:dipeptidyl-peptidase-4